MYAAAITNVFIILLIMFGIYLSNSLIPIFALFFLQSTSKS